MSTKKPRESKPTANWSTEATTTEEEDTSPGGDTQPAARSFEVPSDCPADVARGLWLLQQAQQAGSPLADLDGRATVEAAKRWLASR